MGSQRLMCGGKDGQDFGSYRRINLVNPTMKLWKGSGSSIMDHDQYLGESVWVHAE